MYQRRDLNADAMVSILTSSASSRPLRSIGLKNKTLTLKVRVLYQRRDLNPHGQKATRF